MAPDDSEPDDDSDSPRPSSVHCPDCGTKASADWSFCRSCEASLSDAEPADRTLGDGSELSEYIDGETGCPKCGHADAEVDNITTTGEGVTRLLDIQNRRFKAVSCTRCGYTEFYRGQDAGVVLDLFIG
ncbi:zinc ribbon domain-containing protein [Haloarcula halophila]|uniref:zinc ribbon domain-containing protein n=1 Tax=Haloarcula TaxID=2237 RepID=UPI0023E3FB61|nr:zinc ribbon domain-containing protein [Halomicroarcula sp. DFY41]